jgi:hypothetical protein
MLSSTASSFGHATTGIQYEKIMKTKLFSIFIHRAKDQKDLLKYILTIKNKLSRPQVKYQVHFVFYIIFLCLLSYLVLFIKPSLIEINEEMIYGTCSDDQMFCSISKPSKESWSILQLIVNIWVLMFALEEFRQVRFEFNLISDIYSLDSLNYSKQKRME